MNTITQPSPLPYSNNAIMVKFAYRCDVILAFGTLGNKIRLIAVVTVQFFSSEINKAVLFVDNR